MCLDLIARGIHPNKTLTLGAIEVPERFFSDFVRGYFDADGSVYIYQVNGTPQIKICFVSASRKFLEFLVSRLSSSLQISNKSIHCSLRNDRSNRLYSTDFYINDGKKLSDFMYRDCPKIFMDRKFEIFKRWDSVKRRRYTYANF
jgi:intein-encoded DNA endonuclease-like protein